MSTKLRLRLKILALALRNGGFRSLLALGSVGLGIASMMVMLALSAGAERELQAITDRMGKNLFVIKAGELLAAPGQGTGWYTSTRLDRRDVAHLHQRVPGIRAIVPILENSASARLDRREMTTTVRGVTAGFPSLRNFKLDEGRLLEDADGWDQRRVAVVGSFVAGKLNDGFSLVGETVWIDGAPFEVVGQLQEKGVSDGQNEDDQILVPLETAERRLFNVDYLSRLLVQTEDQAAMERVQGEAREVLRETHALDPAAKDDFEVLTLVRVDQIKQMNTAFLQGMARIFAAITLAIGGAGVLAVTYLNVKDRTSEIGLRMAIGARQRDIASLFLAEACFLSALGGMAGILVGWAGIGTLSRLTEWQMAIDLRGVVVPFVVSVLLGLMFGVAPALKASRVMPVAALRYA